MCSPHAGRGILMPIPQELKKTMLIASIIFTLVALYEKGNKTNAMREIESRLARGFRRIRKQFGDSEVPGIAQTSNKIWDDTVDKFKDRGISFNIAVTVIELHMADAKALSNKKYFCLTDKKIEEYSIVGSRINNKELDDVSREMARYMLGCIDEVLGTQTEKRDLSFLKEKVTRARAEV